MYKLKTYYHVVVTKHNGEEFANPLLPSELHLIATILKDHASLRVSKERVSASFYKSIFGK